MYQGSIANTSLANECVGIMGIKLFESSWHPLCEIQLCKQVLEQTNCYSFPSLVQNCTCPVVEKIHTKSSEYAPSFMCCLMQAAHV